MRWNHLFAADRCECPPCTVCGRAFPDPDSLLGDVMYYPNGDTLTDSQYRFINRTWDVDPLSEFVVCHECLDGHDHPWSGMSGDRWLERWSEVWPLLQRLLAVGVEIVSPTSYPLYSNHLACLECGQVYSPDAKRVRGYWRCPSGCHKGVRLPRRAGTTGVRGGAA